MLRDPVTGNEYDDDTLSLTDIATAVEEDRVEASILDQLEEVES